MVRPISTADFISHSLKPCLTFNQGHQLGSCGLPQASHWSPNRAKSAKSTLQSPFRSAVSDLSHSKIVKQWLLVSLAIVPFLSLILIRHCFEHPPLAVSKTPISGEGGTESGTPDALNTPQTPKDPDLAIVVEHWPNLPEHIKAAINALIQTNKTEKK
jgi:hypothetical protein